MTKSDAERRLAEFLMEDMPIVEIPARVIAVAQDWFQKLKSTRREFMESTMDSIQELSFLNLSQDAFMGLMRGRELPENLSIRFRRPLEYGGDVSVDNMFMCPRFPYGHNLDRFLAEQSGAGTLWIPNPAKKIYVPTNLLGGGDGGNATSDRLSALAAQIAADRGMV